MIIVMRAIIKMKITLTTMIGMTAIVIIKQIDKGSKINNKNNRNENNNKK